jgi:hypothetical protein
MNQLKKIKPITALANVTMRTNAVFSMCKKYFLILAFIIFISVMLFIAYTDPKALSTSAYIYTFSVLIPLLFLFLYIQKISPLGGDSKFTPVFYGILGILVLSYSVFYYYKNVANNSSLQLINLSINLILILTMLIGGFIFYRIFINSISKLQTGKYGFFIKFLFFIPCLIDMLVSYIIKDFKDTPPVIIIFCVFEIILILLYNYLPNTLISRVATDGLKLLDQTTYLNNEIDIANSEDLKANIKTQNAYSYLYEQPYTEETSLTANQNYSKILKNYSISMWIFVNAHNTSTASYSNETTIFSYGTKTDDESCFKPKITYSLSDNKYYIYVTNYTDATKENSRYEFNITGINSQKWNNIVINYNDNDIDLFINGVFEKTFRVTSDTPKYFIDDKITVGSKDGLHGAICNVKFFKTVLTKREIVTMYNIYKIYTPPNDGGL